jgi:hypothetical protein
MGTKVSHIEILASEGFQLTTEVLHSIRCELDDSDIPESSIFDEDWAQIGTLRKSPEGVLIPRFLWWQGVGSYSRLDVFLERVLPRFSGTADIAIELDTGTKLGYRLKNGTITSHAVVLALGDPIE